jgi:hypothetical protein
MTSRSRLTTTRQNDADLRPDGDGTKTQKKTRNKRTRAKLRRQAQAVPISKANSIRKVQGRARRSLKFCAMQKRLTRLVDPRRGLCPPCPSHEPAALRRGGRPFQRVTSGYFARGLSR